MKYYSNSLDDLGVNQHTKIQGKKSSGRPVGESSSCTTTLISSDNNCGTKNLIEYENDDALDIKEELIQDQETIPAPKQNKTNQSKFCTVYIRADDILEATSKPQALKKQKIQKSEQEKKHTCEKCARSYKWKRHLNRHLKYECDVRPQFRCNFCGKLFKRVGNMNLHVNRVHHKTNSVKSVLRHNCDKCSRSYNWLKDLIRHKNLVHAVVKPQFICDFCGYESNMKRPLVRHMISRHLPISKSRHKCDKCSRSYGSSDSLYQHKRLEHAAVIPQFTCDFCDFISKRKQDLSKHINSKHLDK
ncbi:zinc finger protein 682-like [Belonocnema kinseyi]|uniref:zinc finger protein 682-like n=1 Tax=Belonocnema kinseyi TaxID=2817044 RepID=UPI00143D347D|nr:zinc finger protein 682-like [Belonocnema kinseyi]